MPELEYPPNEGNGADPDVAERARIIAETASDAIITIDENSKILFINRAAEAIFGYTVTEMLGQELTMLMPEALRHLHRAGLQRYAETGKRHISWNAYELPGLHKDGREIILEVSFGEFIRNSERFFTGIARDITKRKNDERRLRLQNSVTQILAESVSLAEASQRLLETICLHLDWPVGEFWIVPSEKKHLNFVASWHLPSTDFSTFNSTGETTRFLPGVGIPGRIWVTKAPLWLDHIPQSERYPRTKTARSSGLKTAFGFPLLLGTEIVGVIDFFGCKLARHEPELVEMMVSIGSQIAQFIAKNNAREQVQRTLGREYKARLRAEALTRQLSALQRVTDAALTSYELDELLSELLKRIREVLIVDTAAVLLLDTEQNELVAWAALGLEEEVHRGVRIPAGKGFAGKILVEGKPRIIRDVKYADVYNPLLREKGIGSLLGVPLIVEGRTTGVLQVGTFRPSNFTDEDIHLLQLVADRIALSIEKARLNEIEREARAEAEKANLLKDEFLTILSHELRTPLTPIMGWSQMMQGGLLPERDFPQALNVITKNSQTLKRLIDDLLDMSAILSGKMRIERGPVSLESVLRDAIENVSTQAQAARVKLIATDLKPKVIIKGDYARLVQAFCNLLNNAIKFTPEGGQVEISSRLSSKDVIVSIKDSGKGIDVEFLPYVFERFRQADGSRTRLHGGLGLGLALVKSFVEAHGGDVSVSSEGKDRGTLFSVRLPFEFASSLRQESSELEPALEKTRARILLVEDQMDTLEMLEATFVSHGFEITACSSATEALQTAEHANFDLVISDIAMPELDGFELIRRLRRLQGFEKIPAVALTGYASEKDATAAVRAGFNLHISKPVDPAELTVVIEELLRSEKAKVTEQVS
jgi:PAS domain S-box-containing protein